MANWNKLDNILAWNNTGSWLEGSTPASANTTKIIYGPNLTVARNSTLGAVLTIGQFNYNLNTATTSTVGTGTTTLLTVAPAANFSSIGILVNAGRVTFASPIALSDSQTWQVDSGAQLAVSGGSTALITGTNKNLTKTGAGQLTLGSATASTFTGSIFVNEGLLIVSTAGGLGAAANVLTVASGATARFTASPNQTAIYVEGQGASGNYGAFHSQIATFASGRTVYVSGINPVLSFNSGTTFSAAIAIKPAETVGALFLNIEDSADAPGTGVTFGNSSYVVTSSVRLQSLDLDGVTARRGAYSFGAGAAVTDAAGGFGDNGNSVTVESTGVLLYTGTGTATLSRNYEFLGGSTANYYNLYLTGNGGEFIFNGPVGLTGPGTVYAKSSTAAVNSGTLQFANVLAGTANLVASVPSAAYNKVRFMPGLVSTWTGALTANSVDYGITLPGAVTYSSNGSTNCTIDALVAGLTLNHSAYTITNATGLTFTGTNALNMGGGTMTVNGAALALNTVANTLEISASMAGAAYTVAKSGTGTLKLSGSNTGSTTIGVSAGELDVNNNGALGVDTSAVTFSGTSTLDNTSGAPVTVPARPLNIHSNITWGGSNDLTFGDALTNSLTAGAATTRSLAFAVGGTATLRLQGKFAGASTLASTFNVGTAGSKARLTVDRACDWTVAPSILGGYYQTREGGGLGALGSSLLWVVSGTGALELGGGITTIPNKQVSVTGRGPQQDGGLRSVDGANSFTGQLNLLSTPKVQVDAGSLTLTSASTIVTGASTPAEFAALSGAALNIDRVFPATMTTVDVNPLGEAGTVKLNPSTSNLHTGAFTVSGGVCQIAKTDATGANSDVAVKPGAKLQTVTAQGNATYKNLAFGQVGSPTMAYMAIGA